jgi:hypothetical protein
MRCRQLSSCGLFGATMALPDAAHGPELPAQNHVQLHVRSGVLLCDVPAVNEHQD